MDLVSQQVQGSNMADSTGYETQQAFLAAVDKALISLKLNVLDRWVSGPCCLYPAAATDKGTSVVQQEGVAHVLCEWLCPATVAGELQPASRSTSLNV